MPRKPVLPNRLLRMRYLKSAFKTRFCRLSSIISDIIQNSLATNLLGDEYVSLFELYELFQGSVFAFLISFLGNDSGPLICPPCVLRKMLFPFSKRDCVRVSSLILRLYAVLSSVICAMSLELRPAEQLYVPSLATFLAVASLSLSFEVYIWVKNSWKREGGWKIAGSLVLLLVMVCFAVFVILLDIEF